MPDAAGEARSSARRAGAISACLVVRHEEALIGTALASLAGAVDEILVVHDGPCEDRTLAIASAHGARTFIRPLAGFCEAHFDFVREQAQGEWLLFLDADEYLSEPLRGGLRALVRREGTHGWALAWRTLWEGRELHHGWSRAVHKLCLFRADAVRFEPRVHGRRIVRGRVERSALVVEHRPPYSLFEPAFFEDKADRWAEANASHLLAMGAHRSALFHLAKAPVWFVLHFGYQFFFRLALLNGAAGWRFSLLVALYFGKAELALYQRLRARASAGDASPNRPASRSAGRGAE